MIRKKGYLFRNNDWARKMSWKKKPFCWHDFDTRAANYANRSKQPYLFDCSCINFSGKKKLECKSPRVSISTIWPAIFTGFHIPKQKKTSLADANNWPRWRWCLFGGRAPNGPSARESKVQKQELYRYANRNNKLPMLHISILAL